MEESSELDVQRSSATARTQQSYQSLPTQESHCLTEATTERISRPILKLDLGQVRKVKVAASGGCESVRGELKEYFTESARVEREWHEQRELLRLQESELEGRARRTSELEEENRILASGLRRKERQLEKERAERRALERDLERREKEKLALHQENKRLAEQLRQERDLRKREQDSAAMKQANAIREERAEVEKRERAMVEVRGQRWELKEELTRLAQQLDQERRRREEVLGSLRQALTKEKVANGRENAAMEECEAWRQKYESLRLEEAKRSVPGEIRRGCQTARTPSRAWKHLRVTLEPQQAPDSPSFTFHS